MSETLKEELKGKTYPHLEHRISQLLEQVYDLISNSDFSESDKTHLWFSASSCFSEKMKEWYFRKDELLDEIKELEEKLQKAKESLYA